MKLLLFFLFLVAFFILIVHSFISHLRENTHFTNLLFDMGETSLFE